MRNNFTIPDLNGAGINFFCENINKIAGKLKFRGHFFRLMAQVKAERLLLQSERLYFCEL
jgi:hypothetical protein